MMHFYKMHASGNDYIYFDLAHENTQFVAPQREWVQHACHRHFGIGADGVVYLTAEGGYRMYMYNADGSRGRICGNALRSIGALLDLIHKVTFPVKIHTDAGDVCVDKVQTEEGTRYAVDMGTAKLMGVVDRDSTYPFYLVDVGNRHAVCMAEAELLPKVAERARLVSALDGLNVETIQVAKEQITMQVCEYGTGRTLACGSGAVAAGFVACFCGACTYGLPIKVQMDGGAAEVICHKDGTVRLIGDAHIVYRGEYLDR